jgi:hypothetical protein
VPNSAKTKYVQRNSNSRTCNHCCCGKAIRITYSECVFAALVIQHVMCMGHGHLWPNGHDNISAYYQTNGTTFERKLLRMKPVFFLVPPRITSDTFFILRKTEQGTIKNVYRSSCKVPVILGGF